MGVSVEVLPPKSQNQGVTSADAPLVGSNSFDLETPITGMP